MDGSQRFIYGVTSPLEGGTSKQNSGLQTNQFPHKNPYSACIEQFGKVKRRRKRTSKTKATRRLNPYLLFGNDRRDDIYAGNPTLSQAEIMKIIAEEWRALPKELKDHYKQKSQEEKQLLEASEYGPRKLRKILDDDDRRKPKKAMSAYLCFVQEYQPQVIKMNPNIHFNDVMKLVGEKWKLMSNEEKEPYVELSKLDQKRYYCEEKQLNGGASCIKEEINPEIEQFLAQYSSYTFEFFSSKMNDTLKKDNEEANSDQIKSAIKSAWEQMSNDQKFMYFQQNEQEIKDYISIIDDQLNFCTEDQYDEEIKPLKDITNVVQPKNTSYNSVVDSHIQSKVGSEYLQNVNMNIQDKVKIATNNCGIDDAYKTLIEEKLVELENCFKKTPLISCEVNGKIKSLRDKINSAILCELDTCLLFDSIEKLSNINFHLTSVWERITGCKLVEVKAEVEDDTQVDHQPLNNCNSLNSSNLILEKSKDQVSLETALEKEGEEKIILVDKKLLKCINSKKTSQTLSPINISQSELLLKFECDDIFKDCFM